MTDPTDNLIEFYCSNCGAVWYVPFEEIEPAYPPKCDCEHVREGYDDRDDDDDDDAKI